MDRLRLSPRAFRWIAVVATVFVAVIIVSGGAVRLTESGLGCPSWPNCEPGSLAPRAESDSHAMVEFVNRTFTGLISLAVIAAVLGSLLRRPRRRDLVWLSLGLVGGVVGQIVLGGITVLTDLHPAAVMSHFLLSIVLLTDAIVLCVRAGYPDDSVTRQVVPRAVVRYAWLLALVASVVVVTGTVVTNTGPHAGDREAKRFDLTLPQVARVHGTSVVVFLALVLLGLWIARRAGALEHLQSRFTLLLAAVVVQGAIGYWQYFTGVPALLVGVHLAGATLVWTATMLLLLACYGPTPVPAAPAAAPERIPVPG